MFKSHFKFTTACLATLFLLYACSFKSSSTPEKVSQNYWNAILTGDSKSANELVVENIDLELSKVIQPGSKSEVSLEDSKIDKDAATVKTRLKWVDKGNSVTFAFNTILKKIDRKWKIDADRTQQEFFNSVYQYSLTDEGIQHIPENKSDKKLTPQELDAMLEELDKTTKELQKQQRGATDEADNFLNQLDDNLKKKITEQQ